MKQLANSKHQFKQDNKQASNQVECELTQSSAFKAKSPPLWPGRCVSFGQIK